MNVNWAFLTPRVLGTLTPETVPCLKTVVLGGEAISSEDIDPWTDKISLRIVYGPTECTIFSMGTDPLSPSSNPTSLGHGIGTVSKHLESNLCSIDPLIETFFAFSEK